jgi:uncharacterized protein YciI
VPLFALIVSFPPENEERRLAVRPRHREYLKELHERGTVVAVGPFADGTGALLVYDAASEADVRKLMAADPYTEADVFDNATLHEWQLLFGAPS